MKPKRFAAFSEASTRSEAAVTEPTLTKRQWEVLKKLRASAGPVLLTGAEVRIAYALYDRLLVNDCGRNHNCGRWFAAT